MTSQYHNLPFEILIRKKKKKACSCYFTLYDRDCSDFNLGLFLSRFSVQEKEELVGRLSKQLEEINNNNVAKIDR